MGWGRWDWKILGEKPYAQNTTSLIKYKMQMNVANNVPSYSCMYIIKTSGPVVRSMVQYNHLHNKLKYIINCSRNMYQGCIFIIKLMYHQASRNPGSVSVI